MMGGAAAEPESEHLRTVCGEAVPRLDHLGVRVGREVLISQAELYSVGRSKALTERVRNFVAGWTDGSPGGDGEGGNAGHWVDQFCHTSAGTGWDLLPDTFVSPVDCC